MLRLTAGGPGISRAAARAAIAADNGGGQLGASEATFLERLRTFVLSEIDALPGNWQLVAVNVSGAAGTSGARLEIVVTAAR
jgi:hypothetical protein